MRSLFQWKHLQALILFALLIAVFFDSPRRHLLENRFFLQIDETAIEYLDKSLVRAAASFAMARTFNSVVSVVQESELQLEPGGVGVSLALGAALDPVNDLVERFSWVMLASLTSLGSQRFFIEITPFVSVRLIFFSAIICLLIGLYIPDRFRPRTVRTGRILLLTAVILRLGIPAIAYLNEQVYLAFLQDKHDTSVEALGKTTKELESRGFDGLAGSPPQPGGPDESKEEAGLWDQTRGLVNQTLIQTARMLDVKVRVEELKQLSLELIDRIVDLIVVFVLSTIILPLLFLWGMLQAGRILARNIAGES